MNTTAVITDDISNLDPVPSVGLCECALGTRPVIGAIAASSLMLLACSWFAFNSGVFSHSHDVGGPAPIRIDDATRQHDAAVRTPAAPVARHAHADIGARATNHHGAVIPTPEIRQNSESAPQTVAPVPVARNPVSSGTEASSSPSPVAPTSPTAPVTPVTPALPPTLDDPEISLPPVTLPVTPPDLPSVPAVSTVTTILGVP